MDGLMIDSDRIISQSYETVLKEYGAEPKVNERGIVHTPGISALDNWRNLTETYGIEADIDELAEKKNRIHSELIMQGVDAMPGLYDILAMLDSHGIKMAIASSSRREVIEHVLAHLKITHYFEIIVAGSDVEHGKPAPDIFLKAAENLGVKPEDCVVLEDAVNGVRAAKAAKMKCIAVPAPAEIENPEFKVADLMAESLGDITWVNLAHL